METFFLPATTQIITQMQNQVTARTTHIVMAGGMSASSYLMGEVKQHFPNCTFVDGGRNGMIHESHTICLGALRRYNGIDASAVHIADSFGILQSEPFDQIRHHDATYERRGSTRPLNQMLAKGVDRVSRFVNDRWVPILRAGKSQTMGQIRTGVIWNVHYAEPGQHVRLPLNIYWSKHDKKEGEHIYKPALKGKDYEKHLIDGVHQWGLPIEVDMPNFEQTGFQLQRRQPRSSKATVYEYWVRHEVTSNGPNVTVVSDLAMPGKQPYKKKTVEKTQFSEGEWEEGEEHFVEEDGGYVWEPVGNVGAQMLPVDLTRLAHTHVRDAKHDPHPQE